MSELRTSEQQLPCTCGHVAQEHHDGYGLATCRIEECDCEWYVADERTESAEQYP